MENIYQRINKIREKVGYIQKDGQIQGYKAVTHDQVTSIVRPHLIEHGVIINPDQVSGRVVDTGTLTGKGVPIIRYEADYRIKFVNMDEPEQRVVVTVSAHALDQGDKAPGKALSYATKYAILKLLSIETGESDESRQDVKVAADPDKMLTDEREAMAKHMKAVSENLDSIKAIKDGISMGEGSELYTSAAEAWFELDDNVKTALWRAPTKGGIFTTDERKALHSTEFRVAFYGVKEE